MACGRQIMAFWSRPGKADVATATDLILGRVIMQFPEPKAIQTENHHA